MFSRFLPTFHSPAGRRSGKHDDNDTHDDDEDATRSDDDDRDDDDDTSREDDLDRLDVVVEANLIPSDLEKKALLASFEMMRREGLFCDAAFLCQGVLVRAHRVVVSSWSRWMKTFLCDSPPDEVLSMDIFEPASFCAVVDYMYGQPLHLTVENADSILKVVRRLELQKLEQQCWRYLMTAIDPETNVAYLHELADRYDCPPLKLAAWRILKERIPSVGSFPNRSQMLKNASSAAMQRLLRGTGLTGPGDAAFDSLHNVNGARSGRNRFDSDTDERVDAVRPSVLRDYERKRAKRHHGEESDEEDEDDEDESDEDADPAFDELAQRYRAVQLDELDKDSKATDVVLAWAKRLKEVYAQCAPPEEIAEDDLSALRLNDDSPNVQLHTFRKRGKRETHGGGGARDEMDLDELEETAIGVTAGPQTQPETPLDASRRKPFIATPAADAALSSSAAFSPNKSRQQTKGKGFKYYTSTRTIDWSEVLETFYIHMNLQPKISGIPTILKTWTGREDVMIASLLQKYEKVIPKDLLEYLEYVHNLSETQTESSFQRER